MARIKERRDPIVLPAVEDIRRVIAAAPGMLAEMIHAAWRDLEADYCAALQRIAKL